MVVEEEQDFLNSVYC